jgi:hypothetical protein
MQVTAFSTPNAPAWRWRIVSYSGDVIEESRETFATIAMAVATGARRLREIDVPDRSESPRVAWSTSRLRSRRAQGGVAR